MTINFKEPRYVLPLVVLPFILIFFYIYSSYFNKQPIATSAGDPLQGRIADVSDDIKNKELADKLDAYRNQFKEGDGYTAIGELSDEDQNAPMIPDLYNQREKQMLDSIEREIKSSYSGSAMRPSARSAILNDYGQLDRIEPVVRPPASRRNEALSNPFPKEAVTAPDPMAVFRQQMALIDSLGKANDPEYKAELARQKKLELFEREKREQVSLPVKKTATVASAFNTIKPDSEDRFISAIVDQDITGYSGSRLRLRLLDDMLAGAFVIKKGTYLYAQISGFTAQRVNLTITSILHERTILPVRLEVYDNDGMPGLYVPASMFREFTRELGGNSVQGINLQNQAENNSQLVMSMLQKMFQSTSTAVTRLIRQNKAKVKYNTQVYLIDPEELRKVQKNY